MHAVKSPCGAALCGSTCRKGVSLGVSLCQFSQGCVGLELGRLLCFEAGAASWEDQDWASDYENIALQHGVRSNPASLLALLPAVIELAPDMVLRLHQ